MTNRPGSPEPVPDAPSRRPVAVVTDAATALPPELAHARGLHVTSMAVTVGGVTYDGNSPPDLDRFYAELLPTAGDPPTTTAPRPADWLDQYRAAAVEAEAILCITVSSTLSVAYESARVAAEFAGEQLPGARISVLDSKTAAGSQALVALAAASAAERGESLDAVAEAATRVRDRVRLIAFLDTLEYVWRGGRVPRVAFWAGSLLDLKPLLEYRNDTFALVARPRSRSRATDRLLTEMRGDVGDRRAHVAVMHAAVPDEAEALRERVEAEFDCASVLVTPFPAFMGAHTGPGVLGLAYWSEPAD